MTIKELENRTGMTRANIRFYEGEGLLSPRRLDNGYRDYSEEDALTLEKIKLLRQLQLDIDTIRRVQQGTLTLEQALFTHLTRLEGDKAMIERAAQVCRELERSGVEYAALEPRPWLGQLQEPARPDLPEPPPASLEDAKEEWDGGDRACWHPWQRLFARALDMALYRTILEGLWTVLTWNQSVVLATGLFSWVLGVALLGFTLAVEPLWLHFLGWTPGKLLFGLKLRDEDGGRLTIAQGWERSWRVFRDGYGYSIPFWELWKMWKCRELGLAGRECWWDAEEGYRYTKAERPFNAGAVYVVLVLVCTGVLWAAKGLTDLPRNRGDLTVAEFCQNYNQFRDRLSAMGIDNGPRLDREGQWDEEEQDGVVSHGGAASYSSGDGTTYIIENPVEGTTVWLPPEFTMEDGRITAVTIRLESRDSIIWESRTRDFLALAAMSGAAEGQDVFRFDVTDGLIMMFAVDYFEDVELDYWGLHISQRVDYEGYDPETMWALEGSGPLRFEKALTISLAEPYSQRA